MITLLRTSKLQLLKKKVEIITNQNKILWSIAENLKKLNSNDLPPGIRKRINIKLSSLYEAYMELTQTLKTITHEKKMDKTRLRKPKA